MPRYHRVCAIRAAAAAAPQATWPMAERLERRLLLTTVPGTGGNDEFQVRTHFEGNSEVFVNDPGMNDPPDFVIPAGSHIVVDAGDGDDTLTILTEDGIGFDALDFLGASGDDELVIDAGEGGTFLSAGGTLIRFWVDIPIIHEGTETLTFHVPDARFVADLNGVDLNLDIFQCTFGSDMHLDRLSLSATTNVYPDGVTGSLLVAKSIEMAAGARFELGPPSLLIDYDGTNTPLGTWGGSGYTGLLGLIKADGLRPGFNEDLTVAAAEARDLFGLTAGQTALWKGETVDSTAVLVRTTYAGDANLDGRVNIDDYGQIDFSVGNPALGLGWYNGDFNYDGKIDVDDYGIIDFNVAAQGPPLGATATLEYVPLEETTGISVATMQLREAAMRGGAYAHISHATPERHPLREDLLDLLK